MAEYSKTHRFSPNVGALEFRLFELNQAIEAGEPAATVIDKLLSEDVFALEGSIPSPDESRWAVALSVLSDLATAGAAITSRDSCLYVTWPDWKAPESRSRLRNALAGLREEPHRTSVAPIPGATAALPDDLSTKCILQLLREGTVRLCEGHERFSETLLYRDIFRAAVRSWSMPYRDRSGRRAQFVLIIEHRSLARPVPFGIIEAADGPPYLTRRDERFGLTTQAFRAWLGDPLEKTAELRQLERRINRLLDALIFSKGHKRGDHERTLRNLTRLRLKAAGRSKADVLLPDAKRAVYLERLSKALRGIKGLIGRGLADDSDIYALVRSIRDMSLPRMNVELSICGALPPFASALGGKLVAAFAADPRIRAICRRPLGDILEGAFDLSKLSKILPRHGALLVTTQGLYADHSAQYNGVLIPSNHVGQTVKLEKLGTTDGITTSLISRRTDRLATQLWTAIQATSRVSSVYGTGGSKRQRRLEDGIALLGVRPEVMHPGIPRPVYGLSLVSNLEEVALLGNKPDWIVPITDDPEQYAAAVLRAWRERWLATAQRRLMRSDTQNEPRMGLRSLLAG
jgi:hypothetical protein